MTTKKKKKLRLKKFNLLILILLVISFFVILYYGIKCLSWFIEYKKTNSQINKIYSIIDNQTLLEDSKPIVTMEPEENTELENESEKKINYYTNYIDTNFIDVNLTDLQEINPATIGWVQVNGTNINYPFVQGYDNEYYLTHSFDKSYNSAGWIFMDYRNNIDSFDKNTILYAHGRADKTMFGTLKNIFTDKWQSNPENFFVKISNEFENTLWQVFSIYQIDNTNDYLRINFLHNDDFFEFSNMLLERSVYNFNTPISKQDYIITLSTCFNDTQRIVLHAKLFQTEKKAG